MGLNCTSYSYRAPEIQYINLVATQENTPGNRLTVCFIQLFLLLPSVSVNLSVTKELSNFCSVWFLSSCFLSHNINFDIRGIII